MAIANLRVPITPLPTPDTSWLDSLANSVGGAIDKASQNKSFAKLDPPVKPETPLRNPWAATKAQKAEAEAVNMDVDIM